jgi:MraZ protein
MSLEQFSAPTFAGEFIHGIDSKGRVTIPSDWRVRLEGETYFLVLDRTQTFLHAMPPEQFTAIAARVENDQSISPADRAVFLHHFFSRATKAETDKQGRLLLPEKARKDLGLSESVVLVGSNKTFKIFSKDGWEKTRRAEEEIFKRVAEAVGV